MLEFVTQHQSWTAVAIYWIFSAAVSLLPEASPCRACASRPEPAFNGNWGYSWLFRFMHTVAGNITTAFTEAARYRADASAGSKIPGVKPMVCLLIMPLVLSTPACAAHYTIHPGALNKTDSETYDALLIAEAAIDQARADYQAKRLPVEAKNAFDALIRSYNLARQSWLAYRGAIATNVPDAAYFNQVNQNLSDLTNAIRAFKEAK